MDDRISGQEQMMIDEEDDAANKFISFRCLLLLQSPTSNCCTSRYVTKVTILLAVNNY